MTATLRYWKNGTYVISSVTPSRSLPEIASFSSNMFFRECEKHKKEAHRVCFQVTLHELLDLFLFLSETENKNKSASAIHK